LVALAAGCSTYGAAPAPAGPAPAPVASGAALAQAADIPVGGGTIVGDLVITQPTDGTFKAFSATCTHQGCTVSSVSNGTINCSCHGSKFSAADGSVRGGPATLPLPAVAVKLAGTAIVAA
jgi:Rieske Fe-S protein